MPVTLLFFSDKFSHPFFSTVFLFSSLATGLGGCATPQTTVPPRVLQIQQTWQLQPGSQVAGRQISGGLGDISIELEGGAVYAPFDSRVQAIQGVGQGDCIAVSSPELPAYLLRLCGVRQPKLGNVIAGRAIGSAETLQFAALRKQPDGKWALVEPSAQILSQILTPP